MHIVRNLCRNLALRVTLEHVLVVEHALPFLVPEAVGGIGLDLEVLAQFL